MDNALDHRLKLTTLGEFTIRLDGKPIKRFASRKVDALLVYLVVTKQVHAREHLATILWDDRPLGRSLGNLSVVVNSLKGELGSFLEIERSSIAINASEAIWIDVDQIRGELERFLSQNTEAPNNLIYTVEQALELYRGSFLQGFHIREARGFDEWASLERERVQQLVLTGWRQLALAHLKNWDPESEKRCLRHALEIEPLQEDLHRKLMRNLALAGRHDEAIAQYRECVTILNDELSVEPSRTTRRLHNRILARREHPLDNLPSIVTTTIGRRDEVQEIQTRLLDPDTRLLTLVGVGGIGKTRLALEAARRMHESFLEGLCFVDLAPLEESELVPQALGRALSLSDGISAQGGSITQANSTERLLDYLGSREMLLILDNCEHLLGACVPIVDLLLQQCTGLKILSTSRERFDLPAEQVFIVEPLTIPEDQHSTEIDLEALRETESIRLFEQRAQSVRKPFALVDQNAHTLVRICQALDGMPLAIELTASRLSALSLNQIAEHLETNAQFFTRGHQGLDPRHQTLDTALDWSYRLLTDKEQQLFRLTTIFRGGFDRSAIIALAQVLDLEPISTEDLLAQLVEKSLIAVREIDRDPFRYYLLEPVRQYGIKLLKAEPKFEIIANTHAQYYLQLAETFGPKSHGLQRKETIALLELDADNLRSALRHLLTQNLIGECLRFSHALWEGYWLNQGYFLEGRDWVEKTLQICNERTGFFYGSVRLARGAFAWTLGNIDEALEHILQALEHGKQMGDARLIQWALYWKAIVIFDRSDFVEAAEALSQAYQFAREAGETRGAAWAIFYQGQIARVRGEIERAISLYEEALVVLSKQDVFGAGWCYIYLGHLATERGDLDQARQYLHKSLGLYEDLNNPRGLGGTERGLGLVELEAGNLDKAEEHLRRSRNFFERLGWIKMSTSSMIYLGLIATLTYRLEEATELLIETLHYQNRERDGHSIAHLLYVFGLLAIKLNHPKAGTQILKAADELKNELDVAFPSHLVNVIDQAKQEILRIDHGMDIPNPTWEDCVQRILDHPQDWLSSFNLPNHG